MEPDLFLVFDVESIGLHGEGFAVGYVVKRLNGEHVADGCFACHVGMAAGVGGTRNWSDDRQWVQDNCKDIDWNYDTPQEVRSKFWALWLEWKAKGALLVADCCWPVEARFLAACVDDDPARNWEGPYPLHDLASILLAHGLDPLENRERLRAELPAHHPCNDAMQTARLLVECLSAPRMMGSHTFEYQAREDVFVIDGSKVSGGFFSTFTAPPQGLFRFTRGQGGVVTFTKERDT